MSKMSKGKKAPGKQMTVELKRNPTPEIIQIELG